VLIYLDSRDLITLIEKRPPEDATEFEKKLRQSNSRLVFSMTNTMECCAPLFHGNESSSVMKTLNRLEEMPHVYIVEARIGQLELQEAANAFLESREYMPIAPPLVPRFDYAISAFEEPKTKIFLHYSLAHIIYELWSKNKSLFSVDQIQAERLRSLLESNRTRSDYRKIRSNFKVTILNNLRLYNINFPEEKTQDLAKWIYSSPIRCPSQRLGYEVFHKLQRNLNDKGEHSDIPDFSHISCIPYVDAITLDNRMRGYLAQVDQNIGFKYTNKIRHNIHGIVALHDRLMKQNPEGV